MKFEVEWQLRLNNPVHSNLLFSRPIGVKRRQAACLLLKTLLEWFLQIFNIAIKKRKSTFKIVGIGQAYVFLSHS
jgi:hypothetical protein